MMRWMEPFRKWGERSASAAPAMIERDIDDELAFHLERLEDEFRAQGHSKTSAREEARRRFGDEERVRNQCRFIAMKERIMLQRINVVATIVLLVVVMVMGVMLVKSQRESAARARELSVQVEATAKLASEVDSLQLQVEQAATRDESLPWGVKVSGLVARPGTYTAHKWERMTLARCIAAAGGALPVADDLMVIYMPHGQPVREFKYSDLRSDPSLDVEVCRGDHIGLVIEGRPVDTSLGVAYLTGEVERPGVYNLPGNSKITVQQLLAASGTDLARVDLRVTVSRRGADTGAGEIVLDVLLSELESDSDKNLLVQMNDLITVIAGAS